jgi:hypothetical protein
MARLGPLGTSIFVACGVVAAIALLPFSSWSFRNQLDSMQTHGQPWGDNSLINSANSPFLPDSLWDRSKRDDSLARAFSVRHNWSRAHFDERGAFSERPWVKAFEDHEVKFPNDVEAYAAHARFLCLAPMMRPATDMANPDWHMPPGEINRQIQLKTDMATKLLAAAEKGQKLEPENLYFSYCRTMALNVLGRLEEARQEAYRGAKMRRFEDYATSEGDVLIRVVERKTGYRGEAFRTMVLASILLPHFASMKMTVSEMLSRCPPQDHLKLQWALYRMQYAIARDSSTYIGILVGKAGMNLALARQGEFQDTGVNEERREQERLAFYSEKAKQLAAGLKSGGMRGDNEDPVQMFNDIERLRQFGMKTIDTGQDPLFDNLYRWAGLGGKALVAFIGLLIALPGLRFWAKRSPESYDRARAAGAVACGGLFLSILINVHPDNVGRGAALAGSAILVGLAIAMAKQVNLKLVAVSFILAMLLIGLTFDLEFGIVAAGVWVALLGLLWLSGKWGWLATLVALSIAGMCLFSLRSPDFDSMGPLLMIPLSLVASTLLLSSPAKWIDPNGAGILIALTIVYGAFVVRDVSDNTRLKQFNPKFMTEAQHVREEASLPTLSEKPRLGFQY